jgi:hypothetical protein
MTRKADKAAAKRVKSLRVRRWKAGVVKGGGLKKVAIMLPAPTNDLAPVGGSPKPR